uniref:Uncharacterized protein n=1 Tax=Anguilla anguilla TaxID=7936 RepID=A0A0E9RD72_ANGAN
MNLDSLSLALYLKSATWLTI